MAGELLSLPDKTFLESNFPTNTVFIEDEHVCIVIDAFPLVTGLVLESSDLLIRLPNGYPERRPDMFWFSDDIKRGDGREIAATQVTQTVGGRVWHRWSRHMVEGEWTAAGGLRAYIGYVRMCLVNAARMAA